MARWTALQEVLDGAAGTSVRMTWPELNALVGGLPPSAARHRAWWSGDRAHVRVWRAAGYTVADLVLGRQVTFVRSPRPDLASAAAGPAGLTGRRVSMAADGPAPYADLLLIGCVKGKLKTPAAARDLYVSALFRKARAYAERKGVPWFILSAEHALVAPEEWLAPYDRYLPETPVGYRAAWGTWVVERLDLLAGPLDERVVEVHAGAAYVEAIAAHITAKGATLVEPLHGLTMGQRSSWYDSLHAGAEVPAGTTSAEVPDADVAELVQRLRSQATAMTPTEFLERDGAGLRIPGLYSWWIDAAGAVDLSRGLRLPVGPGLIYAGLAGATRWPSGTRSTNTLWLRIADMHLRGNREFSTFRRTLGAVLADATASNSIDEHALTVWMHAHLRVIAVPCTNADALGRLEKAVLAALDPPLNLQGMTATPVRRRLTQLRTGHR